MNPYINKTAVAGAIERGGNVRLSVISEVDYDNIRAFIKQKIADECPAICTDEHIVYAGLVSDDNTRHYTVNHKEKQYVFGDIHTNTLENVWSLFKRSIIGSYHKISVKHLDRYLDEFEFRFNNRNNPYLFRDTLLRLLQTSNLEYKRPDKRKGGLKAAAFHKFALIKPESYMIWA